MNKKSRCFLLFGTDKLLKQSVESDFDVLRMLPAYPASGSSPVISTWLFRSVGLRKQP